MSNTDIYSGYTQKRKVENFSIFNYYTDNSMYKNPNQCSDFTPPFISYMPTGIDHKDVQLESDLKGITRLNSNCANKKYIPKDINLVGRLDTRVTSKRHECKSQYQILPNQYISSNIRK